MGFSASKVRRKEEGGRRKEEGGRRKEEGERRRGHLDYYKRIETYHNGQQGWCQHQSLGEGR
jgi:hypothetical protein